MTFLKKVRIRARRESEYATIEDFRRIFGDDHKDLYQLPFLLTADHAKAEQCFVAGIDDAINANDVFKDGAQSRKTAIGKPGSVACQACQ
jgi:hypothetical protein